MRKLLSLVVVAALGSSLVACGSDKKDEFGAAGVKVTSDFGQKPTITHIGTITSLLVPTDGLWRGALYNLEPAALRFVAGSAAAANPGNAPFVAFAPPPTAYIIWAIGWVIVVLWAAVWSFNRRDL